MRKSQNLVTVGGAVAHPSTFASSPEELEDLTGKMEDLLLAADLTCHRATWRQELAFRSQAPVGTNWVGEWRNVNADTMAVLYPFSRHSHYDPRGIPYGIDRDSGAWVILDDWQLSTNSSGNTGNSTGPHLHYEARYDGTAIAPSP